MVDVSNSALALVPSEPTQERKSDKCRKDSETKVCFLFGWISTGTNSKNAKYGQNFVFGHFRESIQERIQSTERMSGRVSASIYALENL